VVDDGWFKNRKDDHRALGDWVPDAQKLPEGLGALAEKINAMGLQFGIWMEPEMISVDSDLYRAHPDWAMAYPKNHSEGRNQRILDLVNPQVADYVIGAVSAVLDSGNISYVKWDMNRIFSDVWSPSHPGSQTETVHRYYMSLYRIMDTLTRKYPQVLFEGCASGGARFDLGILCYFPQNWASDNTDAICRRRIQESYSYGYPQLVFTNHVSICPNHQTGRSASLDHRFLVASAGNLGYELNLLQIPETEKEEIRRQVAWYKAHRETLQFGQFTRTASGWRICRGDDCLEFDLRNVKYLEEV
jgi:alpha-galactosidase